MLIELFKNVEKQWPTPYDHKHYVCYDPILDSKSVLLGIRKEGKYQYYPVTENDGFEDTAALVSLFKLLSEQWPLCEGTNHFIIYDSQNNTLGLCIQFDVRTMRVFIVEELSLHDPKKLISDIQNNILPPLC